MKFLCKKTIGEWFPVIVVVLVALGCLGFILCCNSTSDIRWLKNRYDEKLLDLHPKLAPFIGRARACVDESASDCRDVMLVRSGIDDRVTESKLRREMEDDSNKDINVICFDSQGGSVKEAVNLIKLIKSKGLNTCLATHYIYGDSPEVYFKTTVCNSVCPLILLAGQKRFAIGDRYQIGVHQIFGFDEKNGGDVKAKTREAFEEIFGLGESGRIQNLRQMYERYSYAGMRYLTVKEVSEFEFFNSLAIP